MYKVCFVTTVPITLKIFVLDTARRLHEREGIEVTFICDYDEPFAKSLPRYIRYVPIPMKRGINLSGLRAILMMYRLFRKERFDLVQFSTPNAAFYASIASFLAYTPKRLYAQWGIRYVGMSGGARSIFKIIEKLVCSLSTDIRAVSRKNLDFAVDEGLYKKSKAKVIGEGGTVGVDLDLFDLSKKQSYSQDIRKLYAIKNSFVFGFVGRLSKDKGANELLEAFREISRMSDAKLIIVGNSEIDNNVSQELVEWANSSENIIFTGFIEQNELVKYYAAFDCYVHPTYREGFGMVLQEAAAMANAVITTDIPGASEVMEDGKSCILVSPSDEKSLYVAMSKVMTDTEFQEYLGNNARMRVERYFDRRIMLDNLQRDYKELLRIET